MLRQASQAIRASLRTLHASSSANVGSVSARAFHLSSVITQGSQSASSNSNGRQSAENTPIDIVDSQRREVMLESAPSMMRQQGSMARRRARQERYDATRGPKDAERAERESRDSDDFFEGTPDPSLSRRKAFQGSAIDLRMQDLELSSTGPAPSRKKGGSKPSPDSRSGRDGQRGPRIQGQGQGERRGRGGKPNPKTRAQGRSGAIARRPRQDDGPQVPRITVERVPEKYDQSLKAIFGIGSLVKTPRRGARNPEKSVWAKDLDSAKARHSDILRLAGSYDLMLPSSAHPAALPSKASPAERAKAIATWTMAHNPSIGTRKTSPGADVFSAFLK